MAAIEASKFPSTPLTSAEQYYKNLARSSLLSLIQTNFTNEKEYEGGVENDSNGLGLWKASTPNRLPPAAVFPILTSHLRDRTVVAALTGPDKGYLLAREWKAKSSESETFSEKKKLLQANSKIMISGNHVIIDNWKQITNRCAFGKSISLYDTNPVTGRTSGDPIADAFVVKVRKNTAFLAVADGVNWGEAPMRAARCAINAVYEHLETNLFLSGPEAHKIRNTRDAANLLFAAFKTAHLDIVAETTGLSTLCVGLLLPIYWSVERRSRHANSSSSTTSSLAGESNELCQSTLSTASLPAGTKFALIVASVGDSLAFLLRDGVSDVVEVTGWVATVPDLGASDDAKTYSADEPPPRDIRDAGGALGAVYDAKDPELQNLMCAVALCNLEDVVILGTDGLTDNFDPVVTKLAIAQAPVIAFADEEVDRGDSSEDQMTSCLSASTTPTIAAIFSDIPTFKRQKWASLSPLATPHNLPIWPIPPLPPSQSTNCSNDVFSSSEFPASPGQQTDDVSAKALNFTDQLELSWPERRQYTLKEITRIWFELDAERSCENDGVSAVEFGEALLKHVSRVTAKKRQFLEAPTTTKLKAQFSRYMRKKSLNRNRPDEQKSVSISGDEELRECDEELKELEGKRAWVMDTMRRLPGKLDHATVVTLQIGAMNP